MELFKNFRLKIAGVILKKRLARSNRKMLYTNFPRVKNIGVVWDASRHTEFQALARFHQRMHERNIDLKILGYYEGKNLPDQYTAIRFLTCIRKSDINLFYIPESTDAKSFIDSKFNLLIDLNFEKLFPLSYITILSKASFKIGLYEADGNRSPFDLMMEVEKPVNMDNYLKQVIQYLEMIRS